jgi:glucan 1,3-beta-glucosidase
MWQEMSTRKCAELYILYIACEKVGPLRVAMTTRIGPNTRHHRARQETACSRPCITYIPHPTSNRDGIIKGGMPSSSRGRSPSRHRPPPSSRDPRDRQRRRRTHQRADSDGDLVPPWRSRRRDEYEDSASPSSPSKHRPKRREHHERERRRSRAPESEYTSSKSTATAALSAGQLAQLDKLNRKLGWNEYDGVQRPGAQAGDELTRAEYDADRERERERERRRREHRERKRRRREEERLAAFQAANTEDGGEFVYDSPPKHQRARSERRVVSGPRLERGGGGGAPGGSDGYYSEKETYREAAYRKGYGSGTSGELEYEKYERRRKRRRNIIIAVVAFIVILAIVIPVGVVVSKKDGGGSTSGTNSTSSQPANSNLNGMSESDIPKAYQGTSFDPFTWYDTTDFNVTFTAELVGGLPVMGLNSTWDDNTQANANCKPLNETWHYGTDQIRGVNLGGWLSIEPVITPSLFGGYASKDNVVDEYTLSQTLGSTAKTTIEKHYSSFVTEETFANISAAGFDHVRIPFSYWAVITYDGDPYVPNISFRYLLRGIEWARKYGLRVNLDLHGAPGSQNGWNHSGRQGTIGWLNATDPNGTLNGNRTIEIHDQLSKFFAQPRYENIITLYGLVNEPRMVELDQDTVISWSESAIKTIRANNYSGIIVFGDGFEGLDNWQGKFSGIDNLLLDVHQYVIFNTEQIVLNHHDKINFACAGWTAQAERSMNTATGFGPTLCGEWSQADTDCATYLNNVGVGSRWEGTLNMADTPGGSSNGSVLSPTCPTDNSPRCDCDPANADPSSYSDQYKQWLLMFAEAQMYSFEKGWGWFYWTWQTESATQWSYKDGMAAGILPKLAYQRSWNCNETIPMFNETGLPEYY